MTNQPPIQKATRKLTEDEEVAYLLGAQITLRKLGLFEEETFATIIVAVYKDLCTQKGDVISTTMQATSELRLEIIKSRERLAMRERFNVIVRAQKESLK